MTKSVTWFWELPTTRESGRPLAETDIAGVEVSLSADLVNFTVLNTVAPPELSLLVPDLEIGDWLFRFVVIDTANRRSMDVDVSVNIADDTAPGIVFNVTHTLS